MNLLMVPSVVFAQEEQCDCWCGKDGDGAQSYGQKLASDCIDYCNNELSAGWRYLICTNESEAKPPSNVRCWGETECTDKGYEWGSELPAECQAGPPEEHFCYPSPEPYSLNITLGGITEVQDLGDYTNALYNWMLYAGVIVATVMIMIGGVEWMIGAGRERVDSAKKRITGAIIGLVLLLAAYTILATVNPQLVQLQVPKYPLVKQVYLLSDDATCMKALELGFKVESEGVEYTPDDLTFVRGTGGLSCGTKGTLLESDDGRQPAAEECYWSKCSGVAEGCLFGSDPNQPPQCFSCTEVGPGGADNAPKASPSICASMSTSSGTGAYASYNECVYTKDASLVDFADPNEITEVKLDGTCAWINIGCSSLSSCYDYDLLTVRGPEYTTRLDCTNGTDYVASDPSIWQSICEADPCGLAPPEESCQAVIDDRSWAEKTTWDCRNSGFQYGGLFKPITDCLDKDGNELKCSNVTRDEDSYCSIIDVDLF